MKEPPTEMKEEETPAIGENTPVRLGLIIGVIVAIFGMAIGATVYVVRGNTELNTKMDNIVILLNQAVANGNSLRNEFNAHVTSDMQERANIAARLLVIEETGSKATRELAKDLNDLKNEFHVHEAINKQNGGK